MSPLGNIVAIVLLLAPSISAADCAQGSCTSQDETSLLQVKKEVTSGSQRFSEKDTAEQDKPPVRVEPPHVELKSKETASAPLVQLKEEKVSAEEVPRAATKATAALDSQFPGVFVPGGGSQIVSSVVPGLGPNLMPGLGSAVMPGVAGSQILPGMGGGIYGGGMLQDPTLLDPSLVQGMGMGVLGSQGIVGNPLGGMGMGGYVPLTSAVGSPGIIGGVAGVGGYMPVGGYGPTIATAGAAPVGVARAVANTAAHTAEHAAAQAKVADSQAKTAASAVEAYHHHHYIYPHQQYTDGNYQAGYSAGYQQAVNHAQVATGYWANNAAAYGQPGYTAVAYGQPDYTAVAYGQPGY